VTSCGRKIGPYEFLSYGAGVNSTAVMVMLKPQSLIFADTGAEHPETYRFIEEYAKPFVASYGGEFITVRNPKYPSLKDMALADRIIPARTHRWCTDKFKVRPIRRHLGEQANLHCRQMIGMDANEQSRAKPSGHPGIENVFPLIERGIDRPGCKAIIQEARLPVPRKSGCYFCPFQSKGQWIELKQEYPELFRIAVEIERNGANFDQGFFLAGDKPLEDYIRTGRIRYEEDQLGIFKCACYDGALVEAQANLFEKKPLQMGLEVPDV